MCGKPARTERGSTQRGETGEQGRTLEGPRRTLRLFLSLISTSRLAGAVAALSAACTLLIFSTHPELTSSLACSMRKTRFSSAWRVQSGNTPSATRRKKRPTSRCDGAGPSELFCGAAQRERTRGHRGGSVRQAQSKACGRSQESGGALSVQGH